MNKHLINIITAAFFLIGCKTTPISESTIAKIEGVAMSATSLGVAADLLSFPEHRAQIESVQLDLDAAIASGKITSAQLAAIIINKLPLDQNSAQIANGVIVLWGITELWWVAPNAGDAVMAAAKGFSAGISTALLSTATPPVARLRSAGVTVTNVIGPPPPVFGKNVNTL